uniref:Phage major capsid protein, HK97 family n=1 Tax=uncultured marine virus TaxID=186617 RepID=A0A0F7L5W5_9VIRU|nr:phage major capsid protein, HK97 family [uncultured marine virus]
MPGSVSCGVMRLKMNSLRAQESRIKPKSKSRKKQPTNPLKRKTRQWKKLRRSKLPKWRRSI